VSVVSSNLRTHHSLNVVNPRFQLVTGRVWRGTAFGGVKGRTEIPGLVQGNLTGKKVGLLKLTAFFLDYLDGKVKIDEYVTHHRKLVDINQGFDDMHVSSCFGGS